MSASASTKRAASGGQRNAGHAPQQAGDNADDQRVGADLAQEIANHRGRVDGPPFFSRPKISNRMMEAIIIAGRCTAMMGERISKPCCPKTPSTNNWSAEQHQV